MKKYLNIVALLSAFVVLKFASVGWTQAQPIPGPSAAAPVPVAGLPEASHGDEVGKLISELRDADEAKKAELTKQLEASIAKQFDLDMQSREAELTKLEERMNKLRVQLDRRRKAKSDIIQLQLKVMVNEADGLGFTGQPLQPDHLPRTRALGRGYPMVPGATPAAPVPVPPNSFQRR